MQNKRATYCPFIAPKDQPSRCARWYISSGNEPLLHSYRCGSFDGLSFRIHAATSNMLRAASNARHTMAPDSHSSFNVTLSVLVSPGSYNRIAEAFGTDSPGFGPPPSPPFGPNPSPHPPGGGPIGPPGPLAPPPPCICICISIMRIMNSGGMLLISGISPEAILPMIWLGSQRCLQASVPSSRCVCSGRWHHSRHFHHLNSIPLLFNCEFVWFKRLFQTEISDLTLSLNWTTAFFACCLRKYDFHL